jgi:very-short-patch-repair endonuclease
MWNLLRAEPFAQWHFRRQVPIGRYYGDFGSHAARLIIEVDGESHGTAIAYDAARDEFIKGEGYQVVRVSNGDVMNNVEGVGLHLMQVLAATPTRPLRGHPAHEGERE